MKLNAKTYRSRIARRIILVFVACALAPVTLFALFSFHQVSGQLESDARAQLRVETKNAGMAILERLVLLELGLKAVGADGLQDTAGSPLLEGRFRTVFLASKDARPDERRPSLPALERMGPREEAFLSAGGTLLRLQRANDGTPSVFMLRNAPQGSGQDWIVGEVDLGAIWRADTLRAGVELEVYDSTGEILFTSLSSSPGLDEPEVDAEDMLEERWSLFLDSAFLADSWTIIQLQPRADVFAPLTQFRRIYPLVALLSLWIVAFLSLWQIRRSLIPIEVLQAATRRIAQADFDARVTIETDDEFRELGDAFNHMAEQVGDLTHNLEAKVAERTRELADALRELRLAQSRLVHREKMASVGQFVAGIAHEINNPLAFVEGNLHFLRSYSGSLTQALSSYESEVDDPETKEKLSKIREELDLDYVLEDMAAVFDGCADGVQRTSALVKDLRTFSRLDDGEWQQVDLNEALDSTMNILRGKLEGVEVVREYADLPPVSCQAGQVNQVLMNLIVNAADAVAGEGQITVRTLPMDGDRVAVEVEDDGCGIAPDVLGKIFDPFFTTKDVGEGTGLGLAVSYGVIERHGGRIDVQSTPGSGTCFRVELPTQGRVQSAGEEAQVEGASVDVPQEE